MQRYSKPREEQNKHVCFFTSTSGKTQNTEKAWAPHPSASPCLAIFSVSSPWERPRLFFHFNPSSPFFLYSSESSAKKSCSNTRDMLINNWELMSDRLNM